MKPSVSYHRRPKKSRKFFFRAVGVLFRDFFGTAIPTLTAWLISYESFDVRKKFSNLPLIQDNSSWSKNLFSKILNNHGFSISTFIKAVSISCREIDGYEKDKDCDFLHHFQSFLGFSRVFSSKLSSLVNGSLYSRSLSRSFCTFSVKLSVYRTVYSI